MTDRERRGDLWHIVSALQREAGGGVAKAVQITAFFDEKGRLIGRSECKAVKMLPGNVDRFVGLLFGENDSTI